jgi:hypothetical protein
MTDVKRATRLAVLAASLLLAGNARASGYEGWGDTGWNWLNKRDCCNEAIAFATQDSMDRCLRSGGRPRSLKGGGQRGNCRWEWMQDEQTGEVVYHCVASASVWCR